MELSVSFPGHKKVEVAAGPWVIHTDQSQTSGGDSTAPEPFTLFLASIAACAGAYVLAFCQARGLSTDRIRVEQQVEFDDGGSLRTLGINVFVPPGFPERYLAPLKAAVEKCSVKRAIELAPEMEVHTLVEHEA